MSRHLSSWINWNGVTIKDWVIMVEATHREGVKGRFSIQGVPNVVGKNSINTNYITTTLVDPSNGDIFVETLSGSIYRLGKPSSSITRGMPASVKAKGAGLAILKYALSPKGGCKYAPRKK